MKTQRYTPIAATFYKGVRDRLAARFPEENWVVVHANDIYPTNADGTLPHHQNADLHYLTGIDQEETVLLMRVGKGGKGGRIRGRGRKRGRRTTVGGGETAKYEVRSTKYEVEIRRNSVAQGGGCRAGTVRVYRPHGSMDLVSTHRSGVTSSFSL